MRVPGGRAYWRACSLNVGRPRAGSVRRGGSPSRNKMKSREAQLCNIGGREISKRLWIGIAALIACMVIETGFVLTEASRWWRLLLLPLLYTSIVGFLQAHTTVCVRHAVRGTRNMGDGDEAVGDEAERSALRGRGLVIIAQAVVGAAIITVILILL